MEEASTVSRGVVYFSSVPRNMRPTEVRLHFNKFGTVLRMRFIPYPKKERRPGGPLFPLQFREGWMEFASKKSAMDAAMTMNATPVECKRTRKCYDQLWTVKFLRNFSFDDLADSREEHRRVRRMEEVNAKREERGANEAFRRAVLAAKQSREGRKRSRENLS